MCDKDPTSFCRKDRGATATLTDMQRTVGLHGQKVFGSRACCGCRALLGLEFGMQWRKEKRRQGVKEGGEERKWSGSLHQHRLDIPIALFLVNISSLL